MMATYSFKSAGDLTQDIQQQNIVNEKPLGIKTPLRLSDKDGIFQMHSSLEDTISDNLKNLILTNWGERLGLYQFGANLRELTMNLVSQENFDNEAISRIRNAVQNWMPFVDLDTFASSINRTENSSTAIIEIQITYNVPAINVSGKKLLVRLYAI